MALATRRTRPSLDAASGMYAAQIAGDFVAGEALDAGAACYVKSDGKVYMSNGTSNMPGSSLIARGSVAPSRRIAHSRREARIISSQATL